MPESTGRFVAMANPFDEDPEAFAVEFDPLRAFVSGAQCVLFFARRGEHVTRCYVTTKTLVACYGARPAAGDPAGEACLQAYDAHVDEIHSVARQMIRRGVPWGGAVVVSAGDLYRDIVDRHAGRFDAAVAAVTRHG